MSRKETVKAEKLFFFRLHETQGRTTLAACDESLMGKTILHGKPGEKVKFEICPEFYGREKATAGQVVEMAGKANTSNFVGKELISALEAAGVVKKGSAMLIGGKVPHVMTFSM